MFRPVDQRGTEDCERCCYAMMLGVPYESVPDFFAIHKQTRRDERQAWLRENFGLGFISVTAGAGSSPLILPDAPCIAGVASPTGHPDGHAVYGRIRGSTFEVVHDPHPQREKSGKVPFDLAFFVPVSLTTTDAVDAARFRDLRHDPLGYRHMLNLLAASKGTWDDFCGMCDRIRASRSAALRRGT